MTTREKILSGVLAGVLVLIAGTFINPTMHTFAAQLYRNAFNKVSVQTVVTVTSTASTVLADGIMSIDTSVYLSLINSGSVSVSCYPTSSTSGLTYGGGWWLVANGGAVSLDSVALYAGPVVCFTGSGTTTVAVIAR